jgi:Transglycosylase SLT domain/PilZ domain
MIAYTSIEGTEGRVEKRALPRLAPRNTMVLALHDPRQLPSYGIVNDISELGASIVNDVPLETGRAVRVQIRFNDRRGFFEIEARVVWRRDAPQEQHQASLGALHGLEFAALSERQRIELRTLLEDERDGMDEQVPALPWRSIALGVVSLLLMVAVASASIAFHHLREINDRIDSAIARVERKTRELDSGVRFDARRQGLLLGIRDEIREANSRIGQTEAYRYAQLVLRASEKYPAVDPLLFLAVGIVESGYNSAATSHASAVGLYQIQPATGRLLARTLSWEYSDEMLYDPEKNTELAALYLDILLSTYDDVELALAEYNGGPRNAHYFYSDSSRLAEETRNYVPKVMRIYQGLQNRFEAEGRLARMSGMSGPSPGDVPERGGP